MTLDSTALAHALRTLADEYGDRAKTAETTEVKLMYGTSSLTLYAIATALLDCVKEDGS